MATYITRYCPHCGSVIFRGTQSHSHTFGSPQCLCKFCHKIYIDRTKHEIALKGAEYYRNFMPLWVSAGLFLSLIFLIVCLIAKFSSLYVYAFLSTAFFAFIYAHIRDKHPKPNTITSAVIEASEKRLSNPNYASFLKKHGYEVPARYLPKDQ